ncbi:MAG: shikimate dehydrogenase [Acidobacteria bacterium]|nr:shikimate dehydrogenase [Acidobacteriota bacterium]
MQFFGVTTAQSSMMQVFPAWMAELGQPEVQLQGVDLPIRAEPAVYRRAVEEILRDATVIGALITTHKVDVFHAARDLFAHLDSYAQRGREISSISRNNVGLVGHAKDPISCGRSLHDFLGEGYFANNDAEVLCLGAGGAASAIVMYFQDRERAGDRPRRIHLVDRVPMRTEMPAGAVETVFHLQTRAEENDALMATLPPRSIVVNATGMGKDLDGTPVTDAGMFPEHGIVWELNYRGERQFLQQALAQQEARRLQVHDGWTCFLYGWTEVISEVIHTPIGGECFVTLRRIAETLTGRYVRTVSSALGM